MEANSLTIDQIKSNYQNVLERTVRAALSSGRNPNDIKIVVVSKEKPIKTIHNAVSVGIKIFGENYADEAIPKINSVNSCPDLQWHMIGHIQSRKARQIIEYFDYVHSLDSIKIAHRLSKYAQDFDKSMPVLLEFNISGEESKYGFSAWDEDAWYDLLPSVEQILELPCLLIEGIMTIPPYFTNPEQSRPYFQKLGKLHRYLRSNFPDGNWSEISMGMSSDFEVAIEEGATWIRVGQAILGKRIQH